jgi:hypothetical protein
LLRESGCIEVMEPPGLDADGERLRRISVSRITSLLVWLRGARLAGVCRCIGWKMLDAPQLAPGAHGRAADLLELIDTHVLHRASTLGDFDRGTAFEVIANMLTVDVLRDALGDVASYICRQ